MRDLGEEHGGGVIAGYTECLLTKITHSKCRRAAFEALLLIIRHDPKNSNHLFEPMLEAIGNGTELLTGKEQAQNITEFAVLFMPKAEEVLKRIFTEGYNKGIQIAPVIGRTIQLLSLLPSF